MGCSNFCTDDNFAQITASMNKGERIYQAMTSASRNDAAMPLEEAAARFGGDWATVGSLGLAIIGAGIVSALASALSDALEVRSSIDEK